MTVTDVELIREAVGRVCRDFDDDYWSACDREHRFPWAFYKAMADGGWVGLVIPEQYGGGGQGITHAAAVLDLTGKVRVAGGVNQVNLGATPVEAHQGRLQGVAEFLLDRVEVADCVAFFDRSPALAGPAGGQQALGQGGFTGRTVTDQGTVRGTIFLVHGHQGTKMSDKHKGFSRWIVRNVWRNVQRLTGITSTTPARDLELREAHDRAMAAWADQQNTGGRKFILITGHTHRPVFMARRHLDQIAQDIALEEQALAATPGSQAVADRLRALRTELEWVRARDTLTTGGPSEARPARRPCYFNTGCCAFPDGDVTGIEIVDGEIRLVRWPDDAGRPLPKVLASERLDTIFQAL